MRLIFHFTHQASGADNDVAVRESRESYDVYFLGIVPDINMGNSWSRDKEAQLVDRVEEAQVPKLHPECYIKLDRLERLCDKCSAGAVDEQHFLIECSKYNEYRNNLFQIVNCNNKKFSKLDNFQKFFWLLTNEDSDTHHIMGLYLHEHLE